MSHVAIRATLIDDDAGWRGLVMRLTSDHVEFVSAFPNVETFENNLPAAEPVDVVVLDMHIAPTPGVKRPLIGASGIVRVRRLVGSNIKIVILTSESNPQILSQLLGFGADALVTKQAGDEVLLATVVGAAAGDLVVPQSVIGLAYVFQRRGKYPKLQPRHVEVLALKARGLSNREIGARLHIGERSAGVYFSRVKEDLRSYLREIAGLSALLEGVPDPEAEGQAAGALAAFFGLGLDGLLADPRRGELAHETGGAEHPPRRGSSARRPRSLGKDRS